eukprot:2187729-Amphidinium_carterae.2
MSDRRVRKFMHEHGGGRKNELSMSMQKSPSIAQSFLQRFIELAKVPIQCQQELLRMKFIQ